MNANRKNRPWHKGKTAGQKAPFPPDAIIVIRHVPKDEPRDLALFNTAIDTMLRATDLLALRMRLVGFMPLSVLREPPNLLGSAPLMPCKNNRSSGTRTCICDAVELRSVDASERVGQPFGEPIDFGTISSGAVLNDYR